jgi:hypothetical protein
LQQFRDHRIPLECTEVWSARGEAVRRVDRRVDNATIDVSKKMEENVKRNKKVFYETEIAEE